MNRRRFLCCGAAAAGLFSSLTAEGAPPRQLCDHELIAQCWQGLDAHQLWDVHCHLLGTGDSGSGCRTNVNMSQWWHPVEMLRRRFILQAADVPADSTSVDRAYVARLTRLTQDFPVGAKWMLFAFDEAIDAQGRIRPEWTTFAVPDAYARGIACANAGRYAWVSSIHPYREDALQRLDTAIAAGAVAVKWLPSAMNIDLRERRLRPFYARLAATRVPLIVHCGDEKAVPGAGRDELGNPLLVRAALEQGVRIIVAHCASSGRALDLDQKRPRETSAFGLFARLMDEPAWKPLLLGDVSAVFQANRDADVWRALLTRTDWHNRLLHGSDYPLPGVGPLYRLGSLVRANLLQERHVPVLETVREHNPLLFDFMLRRLVQWQGQGFDAAVFATARHFHGGVST
ncbi:MAG: amidohydrolase family protein [Paucibacter sp.]|nr:amidohydrolase family protein [Roseateles sp.]